MSLKSIQGDIFNLDENSYDVAITFVAGGYTRINFGFDQFSKRNENSNTPPYLIYSDKKDGKKHKFYKSRVEMFLSEAEIQSYINEVVGSALEDAFSKGKRIAISGIWIRGLDQIKNETWMVESISRKLDDHPQSEVTIVDIADNINKHGILDLVKPK